MDRVITDSNGKFGYLGYWADRGSLEGGVGR